MSLKRQLQAVIKETELNLLLSSKPEHSVEFRIDAYNRIKDILDASTPTDSESVH